MRRGAVLALLLVLVAACSSVTERAEKFEAEGDWLKAVMEYRKALADDPNDTEYKLRLSLAELNAANHYDEEGTRLLRAGKVDEAIAQYQLGLVAQPRHARLQQHLKAALGRREADRLYEEGVRHAQAGTPELARESWRKALELDPDNAPASAALKRLDERERRRREERFALTSRKPVTLNFRQTNVHTAFEFLAKSFGLNIILDESVDNSPITLFARDVTFEQALGLLLTTSKTFYKQMGPNTLLVAPDTADKRTQYEDLVIRAFHLNTISAKSMLDILKGVITPKKVIVNEQLNTLMVRDTREVVHQVDRLIQLNDRVPAEVLVDVEILEVSRSKALRLGFDFGSEATRSFAPSPSVAEAIANDTITLPAITFRYFKQDVDARTLANPKIRVINKKVAKIHIGDRVPLRSSTIQDATGQTRTTFNYTDIGIRLNVEPAIHLDDSVTLKLGLEVSSLGQNLGTPAEPAFAIGTRNAETFMRLRNGETVILGGLIRDEERKTRVKVPGLGDIPLVGALFTSYDDSTVATEVLLTITPHVMRSLDLPSRSDLEFFSGTGSVYSERPLFSYLGNGHGPNGGRLPEIRTRGAPTRPATPAPAGTRGAPAGPATAGPPPVPALGFSKPLYEAAPGASLRVAITGEQLGESAALTVDLLHNPGVLSFVRAQVVSEAVTGVRAEPGPAPGVVRLRLDLRPGTVTESTPLVELELEAEAKGISYLAFRAPRLAGSAETVQAGASRVVVR